MRYLQALWGNPIRLQSKDRRRTFTEVYRSPRIPFTACAGEQYWLFTDAPPEQKDELSPILVPNSL